MLRPSSTLGRPCLSTFKNVPGNIHPPVKGSGRPLEAQFWLSVPALKSKTANDGEWKEPRVRFPVSCPICARALLTELPVALIAEALIRGASIRLHAGCHDVDWDATQLEVEQIRQYLGAGAVTHARVEPRP